jgi:hypothetical protein
MARNGRWLPDTIPHTPIAVLTEPIVDGDWAINQFRSRTKWPAVLERKETYGISKVVHEMIWSLRRVESWRIITVYSHTSASDEAAEPEVRLLRIKEHSGQVLL